MVNKHAGLFVEYFKARVELLIEKVLKKQWGVVDYYVRYEYQGRFENIPTMSLKRLNLIAIKITIK